MPSRRWWPPLVVSAALLIAAAVLGRRRPGGFVVLGRLDRPFVSGVVALGLLAAACLLAVPHRVWRPVAAGVLAVAAVAWAGLGPGGGRELVVYRGSVVIDPTWEPRVRTGGAQVGRRLNPFTRAEWTGADRSTSGSTARPASAPPGVDGLLTRR